jgi:glycosyltransferase involved in cell wall biosynthesis
MTAMRILHAIRSDGFAGVERFVLRLAVAQAGAGHTVQVIGGDPERMRPALDSAHVAHTATPDRTRDVARAVRRLARDADIVNSHMTAADLGAAFALALLRNAPPLVSTRHFAAPRGRLGPMPIDAFLGRRIRAEIAISRAVAAATGRPSTVVHSGVPDVPDGPGTSSTANAETAAGELRPNRERTVLMAQRLESEKRTDLGIRAFAASALGEHGWRLQIAGEGAERAALESLADELDVEAEFLGFRDDLAERFRTAGLLLAPCTVEGLGLTVIEAMAAGLPVVAADAGGHTESLEGLDPRALYAPDDPHAAARNLRSLAADDDGRAALGAAGRRRQRAEFTLTAQVAGTDAVYRAALAGRHG